MSSSTSERAPSGRHAPAIAAIMLGAILIAAAVIEGLAAPALAGEATARGRKADITWLDEKDQPHTEAARLIRYHYWSRIYLAAPRDGRTYRDEEREEAGFPFAGHFVKLTQLDRVDFAWKSDPASGLTRLEITLTLADGKVMHETGSTLVGASHPLSPWITFTVDGAPRRFDVNPLSSESERAGKARIVSIQITL